MRARRRVCVCGWGGGGADAASALEAAGLGCKHVAAAARAGPIARPHVAGPTAAHGSWPCACGVGPQRVGRKGRNGAGRVRTAIRAPATPVAAATAVVTATAIATATAVAASWRTAGTASTTAVGTRATAVATVATARSSADGLGSAALEARHLGSEDVVIAARARPVAGPHVAASRTRRRHAARRRPVPTVKRWWPPTPVRGTTVRAPEAVATRTSAHGLGCAAFEAAGLRGEDVVVASRAGPVAGPHVATSRTRWRRPTAIAAVHVLLGGTALEACVLRGEDVGTTARAGPIPRTDVRTAALGSWAHSKR